MSRRLVVLACLAVSVSALGCSGGDKGGDDDVILSQDALVATSSWEQGADVQADRIVLPVAGSEDALANLAPGKVLVGGRSSLPGSTNAEGFLVRVKDVSRQGDKVVVMTEPAQLKDAVLQGRFAVDPTGVDFTEEGDTATQASGSVSKRFHYALKPRDLYTFNEQVTGSNGLATVNGKVAIKEGHFDFTPTLAYKAEIKKALGFIPTGLNFEASAEGDLDASLTVTADVIADAAAELDANYEKAIGGQPVTIFQGKPKALPSTKLGPINVSSSAQLQIAAICTLKNTGGVAHAEGGVAITGNANAHVAYDGHWTSGFDHSLSGTPSFTYSANGRFNGECRLNATIALKLFGSATANVTLGAYAKLAATASVAKGQDPTLNCDLKAGAQGDFDGKLEVLGFNVGSKSFNIFKLEWSPDGCNNPAADAPDPDAEGARLCAGKRGADLYCGWELGASDANKNKRYECVNGEFFGTDDCGSCQKTATQTICNP